MSFPALQSSWRILRQSSPIPLRTLHLFLLILVSGLSNLTAQTSGNDQELHFVTPATGGKFIEWYGISGRTYFLQVSDPTDHLNKWNWLPAIEGGNNQMISYEVDGSAEKAFFRLQYTDQTAAVLDNADFDGDGLTNLEEITPVVLGDKTTQTNPLDPDTDHDGLTDKFERDNGLDPTDSSTFNPANLDTDGDGLLDAAEILLGSSIYFADTNGDGIDDAAAVAAGLDPSAPSEDANGDGVPDNDLYIPIFEITEKSHIVVSPAGFGLRTSANRMFLTKETSNGYSVTNSLYYPNIANGLFTHTDTYLTAGALASNPILNAVETGSQFYTWRTTNYAAPALAHGDYINETFQSTESAPSTVTTDDYEETTITSTVTSPWKVKHGGQVSYPNTDPVIRSGTSITVRPNKVRLKDLTSFPTFWNTVVKPAAWFELSGISGPLNQIDQVLGALDLPDAADLVRKQFMLGSFQIGPVTISAPEVDSSPPIVAREKFLKSIRWRWARFNPKNPFEYEYAAPPSSLYRKKFHFLIQQKDYLSGTSGVIKDETTPKEIIELEFSGGQSGSSWQDIPLTQFNSHKIENPLDLASIGYSEKSGSNKVTFTNLPQKIAFDSNRDSEITLDEKDQNTSATPFRFWINNDQDDVESDEPTTVTVADSADTIIKTQRDLEDFSRLKIDAGVTNASLRSGEFKIGLKFKNVSSLSPQIRIWENTSYRGGTNYLTQDSDAAYQIQQAPLGVIGPSSYIFPPSFWSTKAGSVADLIFEGIAKGAGELVITLHDRNEALIGEGDGTWLKLMDVKEMYQRARVVNDANQIPDAWINSNPPAQSWNWYPNGNSYVEDPSAAPLTAIFVHGWRMTDADTMNYSDTSYKRLWHQGFKGKFYSFRWATYSTDTKIPYTDYFTYNPSEYRAWLCGPALAAFVNQLPNPTNRNLIAHSMGNVISGAALRAGMQVKNYAMCNAAMSAMAYDPNPALIPSPTSGLPTDLVALKTPDTDLDSTIRDKFGLSNKFKIIDGPFFYNFGLPNDNATATWSVNNEFFKPEYQYLLNSSYSYRPFESPSERLTYIPDYDGYIHGRQVSLRYITSTPEAMGYLTKSKTRTAGANLDTRGVIEVGNVVNMRDFGFDTEHSAE